MIRKFIPLTCIIAVFVILCGFISVATSAEDNYITLFNGKDLSGWIPVGTPHAFTVKENSIYSTGAGPYPSWLRTEKEYENFVLRFEYRTEGWYEGGVLIHAPLNGPGSKVGLKLHLRHDQKEYGTRSPGAIYDAAAPRSIANLSSGQWNRCEVVCDWPQLRISFNGKVIHDIDMDAADAFRYRLRKGFIGIQNIGCKAYFRNIQIRPLPGKEKWINLFTSGMDRFRLQGEADWHIQNDTLTGKGGDGHAITREEFEGPYELQAWVKTIVNGNGGVLFNYGKRGVEVQCFNSPDSTNPTGSIYGIAPAKRVVSYDEKWFLLQIFNNGPKAMVIVNGEKVCETNKLKPPYKGGIAFQQHTPGAVIHYRGARIKKR
ncbi:MAG: 3-keto-disaccharide hydrolase [Planctomycetota bacterium]